MNTLVTGGGGFIGRHIVAKLHARGDRVRVLGRRAYPDLTAQGVECVQADLTDADAVTAACAGMDAVFHVAAKAGIWGPRESYFGPNVEGTKNVLTGCMRHGVERLIFTSTPSVVYGNAGISGGDESLPYPESHLTPYAETKAMAEIIVLAWNGTHRTRTCAIRPHLVWGPGDTNLTPRLMQRATSGRLRQVGDGANRISVSYVENVADAHIAACDRLTPDSPVCGKAYFVNEPEPVECWPFLNRMLAALECPQVTKSISLKNALRFGKMFETVYRWFRIRREPPMTRFLAMQLATDHWFKIAAARRELGWEPAVSIEDGLKRLGDN